MPFQGTCGTYFTANAAELAQIRASGYLNLRFDKDRTREIATPPLAPSAAHRGFIGSGISMAEITILADLVGNIKSLGAMWASERVGSVIAFSDSFIGMAYRVAPDTRRVLAGIQDIDAVAARWDRAARDSNAELAFGPDSARECANLLAQLVAVARDAEGSQREMYVVQSVPNYRQTCATLGGCDGYGCGEENGDEVRVCHSPSDPCFNRSDCGRGNMCAFNLETKTWGCRRDPRMPAAED